MESRVARLAEQGDARRFKFPRPMTDRPGLDFSFSGLKTFAINTLREHENDPGIHADIAAAFQQAAVETLVIKCRRAIQQTGLPRLVIAGGVGANRMLRERLHKEMARLDVPVFFPRLEFCTDNGAMIALVGALRMAAGQQDGSDFNVRPRWPMEELSACQTA